MIQRDLILTVNNNTASFNEPLIIYQHDRGITLRIKVMKYKFMFNKTMEEDLVADSSIISARAIIRKPNGDYFGTDRQPVSDDCVIVDIPLDWTDEFAEVGKYQLQLQLYGSDYINERVTLPPVDFTVAAPIGYWIEDGLDLVAYADLGFTDYSILTDEVDGIEVDDGELAKGKYEKTDWNPGDLIKSDELNKVEEALEYLVRTQRARAIFIPFVSESGDISWTNELSLENPKTVNIKGPQGPQGEVGPRGPQGEDGNSIQLKGAVERMIDLASLTDLEAGDSFFCEEDLCVYVWNGVRFINCGNIKGPKGDKGDSLTYNDLTPAQKADLTQGFITCSDNITRIVVVTEYPPEDEQEEDVLYIKVSDE